MVSILEHELDVDQAIAQLPENFLEAKDGIKRLVPRLMELEPALLEHYRHVIRAQVGGKQKAVDRLLNDTIQEVHDKAQEMELSQPPGSAIRNIAEAFAEDPSLLRKKIDDVNRLGVTGERRIIGCNQVVLDSRLLLKRNGRPQSLAIKNSGGFGGGKSYSVESCLKLHPQNAYYCINSGSPKSLYNQRNGLKHKCLVLTEAFALESKRNQDSELAYAIRSLLSEGSLSYQRTGWEYGRQTTVTETVEGPTSLITTTTASELEVQLDDRMMVVSPDTSSSQTRKILHRSAASAAGSETVVDEDTLTAWQYFHVSLEQFEVVIPFMPDIVSFLPEDRLPLSARRAFEKITAAIKAITLLYQAQRQTDNQGRLVAEYADYAMAYQLFANSFIENLDIARKSDDYRIKIIEEEGKITVKSLAEKAGVSKPAVSKWLPPLIASGDLYWCDREGAMFGDSESLEKAKKQGTAYIAVNRGFSLPSPFELTADPRWDVEGEFYAQYDLQLEADGPVDGLQDTSVGSLWDSEFPEIGTGGIITDAEESKETVTETA